MASPGSPKTPERIRAKGATSVQRNARKTRLRKRSGDRFDGGVGDSHHDAAGQAGDLGD